MDCFSHHLSDKNLDPQRKSNDFREICQLNWRINSRGQNWMGWPDIAKSVDTISISGRTDGTPHG